MYRKQLHFDLNGYEYRTDLDVEDDNIKIFHYCVFNGQQVKMTPDFANHTPYDYITADEFMCYLQEAGLYHSMEEV